MMQQHKRHIGWSLVFAVLLALSTGADAQVSPTPPPNPAQGSTTSGQTGILVQGAATTAAPSYTTGTTDPLSLDLNGGLRISGLTQGLSTAGQLGGLGMAAVLSSPAAYTTGNTNPIVINPVGQTLVDTEGQKATYRFAPGPITSFAASATDGLVVGGSASKTIRVGKLSVCGTATAATTIDVKLITRAAADTGGTAVAATGVPNDSNNGAVTATVNTYTANPTINSTVGTIDIKKLNLGTASGQAGCIFWQFGDTNGQTIVLRGVAQQLALNFNSVTLPAGISLDYTVEETEE